MSDDIVERMARQEIIAKNNSEEIKTLRDRSHVHSGVLQNVKGEISFIKECFDDLKTDVKSGFDKTEKSGRETFKRMTGVEDKIKEFRWYFITLIIILILGQSGGFDMMKKLLGIIV